MARNCLVFGGSGALGRAVCEALAARGARVAFTYFGGRTVADELARRLELSLALRLDLAGPVSAIDEAIDVAARELGGLDAFVQCAGIAISMECAGEKSHHRIEQTSEADYDRLMAVNVKSTFFAAKKMIGILRERGGGNIVLTGSIDGVKMVPSPVHYATSKGALHGLTMSLAKELGEFRILVNMVAPGILDEGISRDIPPNLLSEYEKHCGLGRVAKTSEVAPLMAWLATENTYITGRTILVDGAL